MAARRFPGDQNENMRRTLVGLVLVLPVLGAGCSSQPSAVSVAQQQVRAWAAKVNADAKAEQALCPPPMPGTAGGCTPTGGTVFDKTCSDERHMMQAEAALERAEGHTATSHIPSCHALEHIQP